MAFVTRATLPQEFFDITSAKLLTQPEPQYLYAKLFKAALGAALNVEGDLAMPGRPSVGAEGSAYKTDLDSLALADGIYSQAVEVVPELGKGPGHTVRINRPAFANTTYTEASREIPAGNTISTTPVSLQSEQAVITLRRFGGPYDQDNSRVAPIGVDRFDSSVALHRVAQIAGLTLKRDLDRTLDRFIRLRLAGAATTVRPTGMTTDNTAAVVGDFPFSYACLAAAERAMDDLSVPQFANGRRAMVLAPVQCQQLGQDPQFARLAEFHRDMDPLFTGAYWKSVGQWDLFKSTTLDSTVNTNNIPIYRAQAFCPGTIGAGIGELPRVATSTQDNYGENSLVLWLMYAGLVLLDSRFALEVHTS